MGHLDEDGTVEPVEKRLLVAFDIPTDAGYGERQKCPVRYVREDVGDEMIDKAIEAGEHGKCKDAIQDMLAILRGGS